MKLKKDGWREKEKKALGPTTNATMGLLLLNCYDTDLGLE